MGMVYKQIENYLPKLGPVKGSIVEIGSSRPGDSQSTEYLHKLAQQLGVDFVTVDIDKKQIEDLVAQGIPAVCQKGEDFLSTYDKPISIVYLDNFDWNWRPLSPEKWTLDQIDEYQEKHNITMTNLMSQAAHVVQSVLLEPKTTANSIIIIDDTWFFNAWDIYNGKGGAAVPYLVAKGYSVLHVEEYGVVLGRFADK
jgi:hypothetical protein